MCAQRKGGLGRGLGALLPVSDNEISDESVRMVDVSVIQSNPHQPRVDFNEDELKELTDSILEHGVIQPLIVVPEDDGKYTLIAGERRLRAAIAAGLSMVPVITRSATDQDLLEIALIENVQREDLSPLETAEAYRSLEVNFNLTHDEIAKKVGKNRVSVTNTIRLLKLPEKVRNALSNRMISEGHARALLALNTEVQQLSALQTILLHNLNVRQTEELVRRMSGEKTGKEDKKKENSPEIKSIEEQLMQSIGTRVSLHPGKKGGTIHIHYYSDEELEDLVDRFTGS